MEPVGVLHVNLSQASICTSVAVAVVVVVVVLVLVLVLVLAFVLVLVLVVLFFSGVTRFKGLDLCAERSSQNERFGGARLLD